MEGTKQSLWGKLPLKTKAIIIGIAMGFISTLLFLVVIITPLISSGTIDINGIGSSGGGLSYTQIDSKNSFLWPIGSDETETEDGITYALGEPSPYRVSSGFGLRLDPFGSGETTGHGGVDISPTNKPGLGNVNVIAAKDGQVI